MNELRPEVPDNFPNEVPEQPIPEGVPGEEPMPPKSPNEMPPVKESLVVPGQPDQLKKYT